MSLKRIGTRVDPSFSLNYKGPVRYDFKGRFLLISGRWEREIYPVSIEDTLLNISLGRMYRQSDEIKARQVENQNPQP
jgi:hypothetical protein